MGSRVPQPLVPDPFWGVPPSPVTGPVETPVLGPAEERRVGREDWDSGKGQDRTGVSPR